MADLVIKPKVRHFSTDDQFVIDNVNRGGFRSGEHRSVLQRKTSTSEESTRDYPRAKVDFEMLSEQTLLRCKFFHPPVGQHGEIEIIESSVDQTVLSKTTLYGNSSVPVFKVYTETVTSLIEPATGDQLLDFEKTKNEPVFDFDPGTGTGGVDVFSGAKLSAYEQANLREIPISEPSGRGGEYSDDIIHLDLPPPGRRRRTGSRDTSNGSDQTPYSRAETPLSSTVVGALQLATADLNGDEESVTDSGFLDPVSPFTPYDAKHRWKDTDEQYQQAQNFLDSMPPGTSSSVPPQSIGLPESLSPIRMPDPDASLVTYGSTQENIPIALPWRQDDFDAVTDVSGSAGFPSDIAIDVSESNSLGKFLPPQHEEILYESAIESQHHTPRLDVRTYFDQPGLEDLSPIPLDQDSPFGRIRSTERRSITEEAELQRLLHYNKPAEKPPAGFTTSTPGPLKPWKTIPRELSRTSETYEPPTDELDRKPGGSPENLRSVPVELHPYLEPMKNESAHVDTESDLPDDARYPQLEDDVFKEIRSAPYNEQVNIASPRTPPPTPDLESQTDKEFFKDSEAADSEKPSSSDESKEREKTWKLQWSKDIIVIPISNSPSKEGNLNDNRLKRMESVAKQVLKLEKKVIAKHRPDAKMDKYSTTINTPGISGTGTCSEEESSASTGFTRETTSSPGTESSTTDTGKEPHFVESEITGYNDVVRDADLLSQHEAVLSLNHEDLIAQSMMELDSVWEKQRYDRERRDGEKVSEDQLQPPIKSTVEASLTAESTVPKESVVVEESHEFYDTPSYRRVQSRDQLSVSLDSERLAETQRSAEDTDVFVSDDTKLGMKDEVQLVSSVIEPSLHLESHPTLEISSDYTDHSSNDVFSPITDTTSTDLQSAGSDTTDKALKEPKEFSKKGAALLKKRSKETPSLDLDLEGADVVAMATDATDGKVGDSYTAETAATIDEIKKEVSETGCDVLLEPRRSLTSDADVEVSLHDSTDNLSISSDPKQHKSTKRARRFRRRDGPEGTPEQPAGSGISLTVEKISQSAESPAKPAVMDQELTDTKLISSSRQDDLAPFYLQKIGEISHETSIFKRRLKSRKKREMASNQEETSKNDLNVEMSPNSTDDIPQKMDIDQGEIFSELDFVGQRAAVESPMCPSINVSPTAYSPRLPAEEAVGVDVPTPLSTSPAPESAVQATEGKDLMDQWSSKDSQLPKSEGTEIVPKYSSTERQLTKPDGATKFSFPLIEGLKEPEEAESLPDSTSVVPISPFETKGYPLPEGQQAESEEKDLIDQWSPIESDSPKPDEAESVPRYPSAERQQTKLHEETKFVFPPLIEGLKEPEEAESLPDSTSVVPISPFETKGYPLPEGQQAESEEKDLIDQWSPIESDSPKPDDDESVPRYPSAERQQTKSHEATKFVFPPLIEGLKEPEEAESLPDSTSVVPISPFEIKGYPLPEGQQAESEEKDLIDQWSPIESDSPKPDEAESVPRYPSAERQRTKPHEATKFVFPPLIEGLKEPEEAESLPDSTSVAPISPFETKGYPLPEGQQVESEEKDLIDQWSPIESDSPKPDEAESVPRYPSAEGQQTKSHEATKFVFPPLIEGLKEPEEAESLPDSTSVVPISPFEIKGYPLPEGQQAESEEKDLIDQWSPIESDSPKPDEAESVPRYPSAERQRTKPHEATKFVFPPLIEGLKEPEEAESLPDSTSVVPISPFETKGYPLPEGQQVESEEKDLIDQWSPIESDSPKPDEAESVPRYPSAEGQQTKSHEATKFVFPPLIEGLKEPEEAESLPDSTSVVPISPFEIKGYPLPEGQQAESEEKDLIDQWSPIESDSPKPDEAESVPRYPSAERQRTKPHEATKFVFPPLIEGLKEPEEAESLPDSTSVAPISPFETKGYPLPEGQQVESEEKDLIDQWSPIESDSPKPDEAESVPRYPSAEGQQTKSHEATKFVFPPLIEGLKEPEEAESLPDSTSVVPISPFEIKGYPLPEGQQAESEEKDLIDQWSPIESDSPKPDEAESVPRYPSAERQRTKPHEATKFVFPPLIEGLKEPEEAESLPDSTSVVPISPFETKGYPLPEGQQVESEEKDLIDQWSPIESDSPKPDEAESVPRYPSAEGQQTKSHEATKFVFPPLIEGLKEPEEAESLPDSTSVVPISPFETKGYPLPEGQQAESEEKDLIDQWSPIESDSPKPEEAKSIPRYPSAEGQQTKSHEATKFVFPPLIEGLKEPEEAESLPDSTSVVPISPFETKGYPLPEGQQAESEEKDLIDQWSPIESDSPKPEEAKSVPRYPSAEGQQTKSHEATKFVFPPLIEGLKAPEEAESLPDSTSVVPISPFETKGYPLPEGQQAESEEKDLIDQWSPIDSPKPDEAESVPRYPSAERNQTKSHEATKFVFPPLIEGLKEPEEAESLPDSTSVVPISPFETKGYPLPEGQQAESEEKDLIDQWSPIESDSPKPDEAESVPRYPSAERQQTKSHEATKFVFPPLIEGLKEPEEAESLPDSTSVVPISPFEIKGYPLPEGQQAESEEKDLIDQWSPIESDSPKPDEAESVPRYPSAERQRTKPHEATKFVFPPLIEGLKEPEEAESLPDSTSVVPISPFETKGYPLPEGQQVESEEKDLIDQWSPIESDSPKPDEAESVPRYPSAEGQQTKSHDATKFVFPPLIEGLKEPEEAESLPDSTSVVPISPFETKGYPLPEGQQAESEEKDLIDQWSPIESDSPKPEEAKSVPRYPSAEGEQTKSHEATKFVFPPLIEGLKEPEEAESLPDSTSVFPISPFETKGYPLPEGQQAESEEKDLIDQWSPIESDSPKPEEAKNVPRYPSAEGQQTKSHEATKFVFPPLIEGLKEPEEAESLPDSTSVVPISPFETKGYPLPEGQQAESEEKDLIDQWSPIESDSPKPEEAKSVPRYPSAEGQQTKSHEATKFDFPPLIEGLKAPEEAESLPDSTSVVPISPFETKGYPLPEGQQAESEEKDLIDQRSPIDSPKPDEAESVPRYPSTERQQTKSHEATKFVFPPLIEGLKEPEEAESLPDSTSVVPISPFETKGYPLPEGQQAESEEKDLINQWSPIESDSPKPDEAESVPSAVKQQKESYDSESVVTTIAAALTPVDQPEQQLELPSLESVHEEPLLLDNVASELFSSVDQDEQNVTLPKLEAQEEELSSNTLPISLFPQDQPEQPLPPPEVDELAKEPITGESVSDISSEVATSSDQQPEEAFITAAASYDNSLLPPSTIPSTGLDPSPVDAQSGGADQDRSLPDLDLNSST